MPAANTSGPGWRPSAGGAVVPIVPADGLYLDAHGCGDEGRLVGRFAAAWAGLPAGVRAALVAYWGEPSLARSLACAARPTPAGAEVVSPRIQLLHGWACNLPGLIRTTPDPAHLPENRTLAGHHPIGQVSAQGYLIRFWAPVFDRLPAALAALVVAHELAHVLQHAEGRSGRMDHQQKEADADAAAERWGFGRREQVTDWLARWWYPPATVKARG